MADLTFRTIEWLRATRWRKRIEEVLAPSGLTFTQWLVLDAIRELAGAAEAAVSQHAVAARLEMHRSTVSDATLALSSKGLVARGAAARGPSWHVVVTLPGRRLLADLDPRTDHVSSLE